ncbi:MAG: hypothetical protein OSA40_09780 [Phycisphaerales bacterium]|nr:hypothetical protein [Phycisphaerales bacterium]
MSFATKVGAMPDSSDPRPRLGITLAPLASDPRMGLQAIRTLGIPGVQISAGQKGTRPGDLGQSGRRDLLVSARRLELEITGVDAWLDPDCLADSARVDDAVSALLGAIRLAEDLGHVPVSTRFPGEDDEGVIEAVLSAANRVGVGLVDHGVPPRGMPVRALEARRVSGLIIPGETDESVRAAEPPSGTSIDGLGIGIDPPAWLVAGLDCLDAVGKGIAALRLADLSRDGMRVPIGDPDGRLDGEVLLVTARTARFDGIPVIDARRWIDPIGMAKVTIDAMG